MSRVTSSFFVMITTGFRNSTNTSRQRRVSCKAPFDRLIRIGDAADRDHLRLPSRRGQFTPQQCRRVLFHQDLRFEIESRREAEIFMIGPGKTINATVLASAIRIDAGIESDVGTVVVVDDGAGLVSQKNGRVDRTGLPDRPIPIRCIRRFLEPIRRIARGAAASNLLAALMSVL